MNMCIENRDRVFQNQSSKWTVKMDPITDHHMAPHTSPPHWTSPFNLPPAINALNSRPHSSSSSPFQTDKSPKFELNDLLPKQNHSRFNSRFSFPQPSSIPRPPPPRRRLHFPRRFLVALLRVCRWGCRGSHQLDSLRHTCSPHPSRPIPLLSRSHLLFFLPLGPSPPHPSYPRRRNLPLGRRCLHPAFTRSPAVSVFLPWELVHLMMELWFWRCIEERDRCSVVGVERWRYDYFLLIFLFLFLKRKSVLFIYIVNVSGVLVEASLVSLFWFYF